jgi:Leucine-rich repeat (LRR) protein
LTLLEINLRGNTLISQSARVFGGASNLQRIDLSHNKLKFIAPETFKSLPSLVELDLSFNEIHNNTFGRKGTDWVDAIESLKVLDLSNNNLAFTDAMPYQAFSGLLNLESLNLSLNGAFGKFIFL